METTLDVIDAVSVRRDFPMLQRAIDGKPLVYLDSAATSQKPRVMIDRLGELYAREYAKVDEGHTLSKEATRLFERARETLAALLNAAESREILFFRGATEALNHVAHACARGWLDAGDEVLVTAAEHHSNIIPWLLACRQTGAMLRGVPVLESGDLDLDAFERMLTDRVKLVALTHTSNVTGALFPVKRATALAHARGIPVLVDGAQAMPHVPVDVRDIDCELYAGSGHKMGGPSSVGCLYGKASFLERLPVGAGGATMAERASFEDFTPKPLPNKHQAGEPAFAEVVAWQAALDYWSHLGLARIDATERELTAYAAERIARIDGVRVLGHPAERISIVSFVVEGTGSKEVEQALDQQGIAVRAGTLDAVPMLDALGVRDAVRASFVFYNTRDEADALADALTRIAAERHAAHR
jgi:cysteine desulfurase/selenocysteine lyase